MAATVWKGHLTFGLVSIPVRLYRAARAEKVSMHQLYRAPRGEAPRRELRQSAAAGVPFVAESPRHEPPRQEFKNAPQHAPAVEEEIAPLSRIRQAIVNPVENTPIPRSDLVRGYEYAKDQYVVIEQEDIRKITPETATEMQIVEFVRFSEIDPIYLETSYYMAPDEAGEKAYALLFEGMRESGYVALAQVAMHRREHVMILRPGKSGIITHTMFYPDEVRTIQEFRTDVSMVTPKELGLAKMLIDTLAQSFEPAKFKDAYRERLKQLIEAKVQGQEVAPVAAPVASKVVDIMEALQKSLAAAGRKVPAANEEPPPRKSAKSERPATKKREQR